VALNVEEHSVYALVYPFIKLYEVTSQKTVHKGFVLRPFVSSLLQQTLWQFTPLLNSRSPRFGFTPFGWFTRTYENMEIHFSITPFLFTPTFQEFN